MHRHDLVARVGGARAVMSSPSYQHVFLHPDLERLLSLGDLVPRRVELVVAARVAVRVPTGAHRREPRPRCRSSRPGAPRRRTGASNESTTSSTVTIDRRLASTHSRCTPVIPHIMTLPCRSACWAWMMPTSGLSAWDGGQRFAGERTRHRADRGRVFEQARAGVAPKGAEREPRRAGCDGAVRAGRATATRRTIAASPT